MDQAIALAEMMARSKLVPRHLQGSVGDCFLVVEQATRWRMSPFAVAQATSVIQGKLMYEGKLVAAAVHTCGATSTRLDYDYGGEGEDRWIVASAVRVGEDKPREVRVLLADAKTENPLWRKQPDQQLSYHAARVWARRWTPEVILGVFAPEEMEAPPAPVAHHGPTIEAHAEPAPQPAPAVEAPKRTLSQFIDALEVELRTASGWDELVAIVEHEDVRRARDVARNGMAQRLENMIVAAQERVGVQGEGGA
tara:strand:- start:249 stop:1004 length:756 start_codon:yes stop_codon:yes gene_type:complete